MSPQMPETPPLVREISDLYKAYRLLSSSDVAAVQTAAAHTQDAIVQLLETAHHSGLPETWLRSLFFDAPVHLIENALRGEGPREVQALLDAIAPTFNDHKCLPISLLHRISGQGLERLIARGFPYLRSFTDANRAKLCMIRGEEVGMIGWTNRKPPEEVFLEQSGLRYTQFAFHADGIRLLGQAVRRLRDDNTGGGQLELNFKMNRKKTDWRLYLAFFAAGPNPPGFLLEDIVIGAFENRNFANSIKRLLLREPQSSHERLARQRWLSSGPTPEELLAMPYGDMPSSIEDIFGPAPKPMKTPARHLHLTA